MATVVLGLGNPGPDYAGHRHNAGAMALAVLAADVGVAVKRGRGRLARTASAVTDLSGRRVILTTLTSYMNESGSALSPLLDYYKIAPDSLIVIHDELDLPFGTIRIKHGGGDNGHNGLRSITRSLGTPDYSRVRIGIGRPTGRQPPADFVLHDFGLRERAELPMILDEAARAVSLVVSSGVTDAQNEIHRP